jgi:hypothetical protein
MERRITHAHFRHESIFAEGGFHRDMIGFADIENGRQHIGHMRVSGGRADEGEAQEGCGFIVAS